MIGDSTKFKPISLTTQRLVDRCLMAKYFEGLSSNNDNYLSDNNKSRLPITPNSLAFPINSPNGTHASTPENNGANGVNGVNGVNLQGKFLTT